MTSLQTQAYKDCVAAQKAFAAAEKKLTAAQAVFSMTAVALKKAQDALYESMYEP